MSQQLPPAALPEIGWVREQRLNHGPVERHEADGPALLFEHPHFQSAKDLASDERSQRLQLSGSKKLMGGRNRPLP
ncbi:hypothetical protein HK414_23995 [Ramlibacter terrae]|uniref:Uncharacterized protein n=1 Tax=Ramlibacter terrae TaxID=2732511 RepID=A0ABX6P5C0_9BURK|nr:hypothetical protein HK414_23995 [Ramlibacter terrae]